MRLVILAALIACASAASIFDVTLDTHWANYKEVHGKDYGKDDTVKRLIWEANLNYINKHNEEANNGLHTYTLKMNKFGDLTSEEFGAIYNGYRGMKQRHGIQYSVSGKANPDSVDWRKEGYVTPIKDQGQCGSCWAFSTVASLEGQHFKANGTLVSLSESNLVDCSQAEGNQGCNGGLMDQGFEYIKKNGGIDTEASYPYVPQTRQCRFKKDSIGATDTGFVDIAEGSESALEDALATVGPISVAIDASHMSFQFYDEGIYNEPACSSSDLDHGVTAVGYGSNDQGDYWIVKNSWGEVWGMDGYILMSRNKHNQCGIASAASYPTV